MLVMEYMEYSTCIFKCATDVNLDSIRTKLIYRKFQKGLYNGIQNFAVWRVLQKRLHLKAYKLCIISFQSCKALFETPCTMKGKTEKYLKMCTLKTKL
jgi:hypothetical protein